MSPQVTQAFIMLGTLIVAPIAAFSIKDTRNMKGLLKRVGAGECVCGVQEGACGVRVCVWCAGGRVWSASVCVGCECWCARGLVCVFGV